MLKFFIKILQTYLPIFCHITFDYVLAIIAFIAAAIILI